MIKVKVEENNNYISKVTIKGHANYDELGKDIVCAAVSSIVITAPIGSTIPDRVPYKNALNFDTPSLFKGIEIIAPSGKF